MSEPLMDRLSGSEDSRDDGLLAAIGVMALRALDRVYESFLSPWAARSLCETDESFILMELLLNDESLHG